MRSNRPIAVWADASGERKRHYEQRCASHFLARWARQNFPTTSRSPGLGAAHAEDGRITSHFTFFWTKDEDEAKIDTTHIESQNVGSVNLQFFQVHKMDASQF